MKAFFRKTVTTLIGITLLVAPIAFAHYYFTRVITNPVSTTDPVVLGAPTTSTAWFCVTAAGVAISGSWATQALADLPCGTAVATDGVTRYLEERVTETRANTTTTRTRRVEVLGGTTLKISDANAGLLNIAGSGPPPTGGGGGGGFLSWTAAPGATGYKVYGNLNYDGPPYYNVTDVGNVTTVSQAALTWVTSGTWYFNIRSYDESLLEGPWGDQIQVIVP